MEIVKKNLVSIILGVIALAAVVAGFYPLGGWWTDLKAQAQTRRGSLDEAKQLISKPRTLPVVTPTGEPQPLDAFPNRAMIEVVEKLVGQARENSQKFLQLAVEKSRRQCELLTPGSLPGVPGQSSPQIQFRRQYQSAMNTLGAAIKDSMPAKEMKAGTPPTPEDFQAAAQKIVKEVEAVMLQKGPGGVELNRTQVNDEINRRIGPLTGQLQKEAAEKIMVYVNQTGDSFTIDPNIVNPQNTQPPDPSQVFWAQINFWCQQELCRAIYDVNTNSPGPDGKTPAKNVLEAPIKHVLKVAVPPTFVGINPQQSSAPPGMMGGMPGFPGGEAGAEGAAPTATPFDPNAPLVRDYTHNFTGRKSGGIIDVMLFDVEMIVDAQKLPYVLQRLEQDRYLMVSMVHSIVPVDSSIAKAQGYLYGDRPVVRVHLSMEMVFMREWLLKIMPKPIMDLLQVAPPAPTQPPA